LPFLQRKRSMAEQPCSLAFLGSNAASFKNICKHITKMLIHRRQKVQKCSKCLHLCSIWSFWESISSFSCWLQQHQIMDAVAAKCYQKQGSSSLFTIVPPKTVLSTPQSFVRIELFGLTTKFRLLVGAEFPNRVVGPASSTSYKPGFDALFRTKKFWCAPSITR
jgi:hypothetical protein